VEENVGRAIHEYGSAAGVNLQMTGTTKHSTTFDLPGEVQALYSGGSMYRFRYPDWQGSIRAESAPGVRGQGILQTAQNSRSPANGADSALPRTSACRRRFTLVVVRFTLLVVSLIG